MAYPTGMSLPRALGTVYEAKLFLVMPGANALTREITATILARDGLLDAQDTVPVPSSAAVRRKSAARRAQAAALCNEVQRLCAQAILLQREAKQLCKPPV
jgi:hypothetical protein